MKKNTYQISKVSFLFIKIGRGALNPNEFSNSKLGFLNINKKLFKLKKERGRKDI